MAKELEVMKQVCEKLKQACQQIGLPKQTVEILESSRTTCEALKIKYELIMNKIKQSTQEGIMGFLIQNASRKEVIELEPELTYHSIYSRFNHSFAAIYGTHSLEWKQLMLSN